MNDLTDKYKQMDEMDNILMLNSLNCKCSILPIFKKYTEVNSTYINSIGCKEKLRNILIYMSSFLSVTDRTINLRLMCGHFSEFNQKTRSKKYLGYNKEEINALLDKYFYFQFTVGFYQGWDSHIDLNNDILFYDKKWLKIFYDAVKRSKTENILKCSDLIPLKHEYKIYKLYLLNQKHVPFVAEIVRTSDTFDEFIELIIPYLEKMLD